MPLGAEPALQGFSALLHHLVAVFVICLFVVAVVVGVVVVVGACCCSCSFCRRVVLFASIVDRVGLGLPTTLLRPHFILHHTNYFTPLLHSTPLHIVPFHYVPGPLGCEEEGLTNEERVCDIRGTRANPSLGRFCVAVERCPL
jgi:hypothetical protein